MQDKAARNQGIDVARGLAVVLMIQTHLYDGWVAPSVRTSSAFAITRFLGIFPLPTFLLLAGVGVALRIRAGERRAESATSVRADLLRRGLRVFAAGYAVSLLLGLMDGARDLDTYLRIDVLHAIGLSIMSAAAIALPFRGAADARPSARRGLVIVLLAAVLVVPGTHLGRAATGPARFVLAPFVEAPGLTRMPMIPLIAWLGMGMILATFWFRDAKSRLAHARLAIASAIVATLAFVTMHAMHARLGGSLDRTHPAIFANLVDLGARATALLAGTMAIASSLPRRVHDELARLGRHSLLAYAVHLPFAYGRPMRAFSHRCDFGTSSLGLVALLLFTIAVVYAYDRLESDAS